jgi:hypothetical protein
MEERSAASYWSRRAASLSRRLGARAARGIPVRKVLARRGWSRTTFYRKLDSGAARIAAILSERGVAVR